MGLLQKLLSTLGLRNSESGRRREQPGESTVTVEHEPDTRSESAVKGTEGVSADTTASGSTGTITDTADEGVGAAEPSEAAGTAAGDLDEEPDVDEAEEAPDSGGAEADEAGSDAQAAEEGDGAETADEDGDAETAAENDGAGAPESPDVLNGIGPAYAERLSNAGIETVGDLAEADASAIAERTDLGEGRLANWIEQAKEY